MWDFVYQQPIQGGFDYQQPIQGGFDSIGPILVVVVEDPSATAKRQWAHQRHPPARRLWNRRLLSRDARQETNKIMACVATQRCTVECRMFVLGFSSWFFTKFRSFLHMRDPNEITGHFTKDLSGQDVLVGLGPTTCSIDSELRICPDTLRADFLCRQNTGPSIS